MTRMEPVQVMSSSFGECALGYFGGLTG